MFIALEHKPGDMLVNQIRSTSARVCWRPIPIEQQNCFITGYTVRMVQPDSNFKREVPAGITSYMVSVLSPFTEYTFEVCAKTKTGPGPAASVKFKTKEDGKTYISLCNLLHPYVFHSIVLFTISKSMHGTGVRYIWSTF